MKMILFADLMEHEWNRAAGLQPRRVFDLLALLPDTFTRDDLRTLRRQLGLNENWRKDIYNWKRRGKITDCESGTYKKQ